MLVMCDVLLYGKEAKDFIFDNPDINIDRTGDIKLKGKIGKKTSSEDSTDDALDILEGMF